MLSIINWSKIDTIFIYSYSLNVVLNLMLESYEKLRRG